LIKKVLCGIDMVRVGIGDVVGEEADGAGEECPIDIVDPFYMKM
jgi:hypothetical protein